MAAFNLTVTYPDGEGARIMTALKSACATAANPSPSNAQAIEWLRLRVVQLVKTTVHDEENKAALNAIADINAS